MYKYKVSEPKMMAKEAMTARMAMLDGEILPVCTV
jgi:hypothetical protein